MYAYRVPDLSPEGGNASLAAHPQAKRLVIAGPWQLCRHREGGSLVTWRGASADLDSYAPGVATADGMTFYGWKSPKTKAELAEAFAKADSRPESRVSLACGLEISVALATRGSRRRTFAGTAKVGGLVDEFSLLAAAIFERLGAEDEIPQVDASLCRYLFLAIALRYRVTEEAMDAWDILSTADDGPIWYASLGADPKAGAAAGA